jgi:hypothetical protein
MIEDIKKQKSLKNKRSIGDISEAKVIARLTELGCNVSIPFLKGYNIIFYIDII